MSVTVNRLTTLPVLEHPHPNDVDRKRIERALLERKRYRYVEPSVAPATDGYRITSPCCSRNIDQAGGLIDIARIEWEAGVWTLFSRDHVCELWRMHTQASRLDRLMDCLNEDSKRVFWQ